MTAASERLPGSKMQSEQARKKLSNNHRTQKNSGIHNQAHGMGATCSDAPWA